MSLSSHCFWPPGQIYDEFMESGSNSRRALKSDLIVICVDDVLAKG